MNKPDFKKMTTDLIGDREALADLRESVETLLSSVYELGIQVGTTHRAPRFSEESQTVEFECMLTDLDVQLGPTGQSLTLCVNTQSNESLETLAGFCQESITNYQNGRMKGKMRLPASLSLTKDH